MSTDIKSATRTTDGQKEIKFWAVKDGITVAMCRLKLGNQEAWLDTITADNRLATSTRVRQLNIIMEAVETYLKKHKLSMHGETNPRFAKYLEKRKGYTCKKHPYIPGMQPKVKMHYLPK